MNSATLGNILCFFVGVMAASIFWIFFRLPAPRNIPPVESGFQEKQSEARTEKRSDRRTSGDMLPVAEGAAVAPVTSTKRRWIDAVSGITAEDEKARAQREVTRVTLARLQRHLAAAPVRPADMAQLLDLLSYKQNLNYEFAKRRRNSGLPTKGGDYDRQFALEEERLNGEIKALVGEDYFNEMMSSFRRFDDRLYGVEFIGEAVAQGESLTPEQRQIMNQVINTLDPRAARGKGEEAPDPDTGLTSYDQEVAKALEEVLSPQQIRIFKEVRADWNLFWEAKRIHGTTKNKQR